MEQVEDDSCLSKTLSTAFRVFTKSKSLSLSESQQRIRYIEDVLLSIHRVEANYRKPRREKFETFLMKLADVEIHNDMEFSRTERKRKRVREREMHANRPSFFFSFFFFTRFEGKEFRQNDGV